MASNFFWDRNAMEREGANPTILAIGDSWFWYPMPGGSLVNNIGELVKSSGHVIYARGMNGAEAFDYVDGRYADDVREALRLYGKTPAADGIEAAFISGGGNDFAGLQDMLPLLKADCSTENAPAGCFREGAGGLAEFLDRMDKYYRRLIGLIYTHTAPGCKILMHSYDYANPDGKAVIGDKGWLKPALDQARVPAALQAACIRHLIDSFHAMLEQIVLTDPANLVLVDGRGVLKPNEWANELHPNGTGFRKIAEQAWKPALLKAKLIR